MFNVRLTGSGLEQLSVCVTLATKGDQIQMENSTVNVSDFVYVFVPICGRIALTFLALEYV